MPGLGTRTPVTFGLPQRDRAPRGGTRAAPVRMLAEMRSQCARFTADTTARSDAVVIEVAMPTPHTTLSPIAHST